MAVNNHKNNINLMKIAILNLGCKVNAYETEAMKQKLAEQGADIVEFNEKADVYIVNTCTVTSIADKKSRQMLHRAKHLNPDSIVIAVGCYAQEAGDKLLTDNAVDVVVGNNRKKDIVNIINDYLQNSKDYFVDNIGQNAVFEDFEGCTITEKTRAYVKIQDGCNRFCSYCIIPYVRGRIRSRLEADVIREVNELAEHGYKEFVLTGIHLSSYGMENGPREDMPLIKLTQKLADIHGVERIRFGSLEPGIVTEAFTEALARIDKVCPHFHLSLQSGCDDTLKRMNRRYSTDEYLKGCDILRKYYIKPAITTDIIVGFPGETDEEFKKTLEFAEKVKFAQIHIFKYSRRQGTVADRLPGQVNEEIKNKRSDELFELENRLARTYMESFLNEQQKVLIEENIVVDDIAYMTGHNERYVKMAFKCGIIDENTIITGIPTGFLKADTLLCEFID